MKLLLNDKYNFIIYWLFIDEASKCKTACVSFTDNCNLFFVVCKIKICHETVGQVKNWNNTYEYGALLFAKLAFGFMESFITKHEQYSVRVSETTSSFVGLFSSRNHGSVLKLLTLFLFQPTLDSV